MRKFKSMVIVVSTLAAFLAGYVVYAYFLGEIDGLPPLPVEYAASERDNPIDGPTTPNNENKLELAFGKESPETRRPIKLDLHSKHFALAADYFDIEQPKGERVKLFPFSAALFPKSTDGKYPEINTIQCDEAYLTLDRPVSNLAELGSRRIVAVELKSNREIVMTNNRRTPEKSDDIEIVITHDSLIFEELANIIRTDGFIKLQDNQTHPHPTIITARGMELNLSKETPAKPRKGPPPKKGENVQGVELLTLKANVEMHLYVGADAGFLGGATDKDKGPAKSARRSEERSRVVIKTPGPFCYDLPRELARFDSPPVKNGADPASPEEVTVSREHRIGGVEKFDQLICNHLELQFVRKAAGGGASGAARTDKEIETALATAAKGKEVNLTLESEDLVAYGHELFYRNATAAAGAQTTLKGSPLFAMKEKHKITCLELRLIAADKKGMGQQAFAKGPGQIDLYDKSNIKKPYPFHVFFKDSLISNKERDGDKFYELLTLSGDAAFIDEERQQELQGARLQLWLDQPDKSSKAVGAPRQRPHRVVAYERVSMRSPELIIDRCDRLTVRFEPRAAPGGVLPKAIGDAPKTDAKVEVKIDLPPRAKEATVEVKKDVAPPKLGAPIVEKPAEPRKPLHLTATDVTADIADYGPRKTLLELLCNGAVHVEQEGKTPKDKGVDIKGDKLKLVRHETGDILTVFGETRTPAQLQLGELTLIGPIVTINQQVNVAEVDGPGAMHMPSKTSFEGKAAKPGAKLTIHWNKDMIFTGRDADFSGGVQALQDGTAMKCDKLSVTLDRTVSFKEGQKSGQPASVERIVCYRKVFVDDRSLDEKGGLIQYNRLICSELDVNNQDNRTVAPGPGRFYHLALGEKEDFALKAPEPAAKAPMAGKTLVYKLTRVDYEQRMFANTNPGTRNAKFYGNVEVYHLEADNPDAPVNPDNPGKDGFYMRCDVLAVFTRTEGKKSVHEMEAIKNVTFKTEKFFGRAETIKYDQAQEQIIFEGTAGNPATLFLQRGPGVDPQEIKGNKIKYNRRTGEFHLEGGRVIRLSLERSRPTASFALARLDANRQDEPFVLLGLVAGHDG